MRIKAVSINVTSFFDMINFIEIRYKNKTRDKLWLELEVKSSEVQKGSNKRSAASRVCVCVGFCASVAASYNINAEQGNGCTHGREPTCQSEILLGHLIFQTGNALNKLVLNFPFFEPGLTRKSLKFCCRSLSTSDV